MYVLYHAPFRHNDDRNEKGVLANMQEKFHSGLHGAWQEVLYRQGFSMHSSWSYYLSMLFLVIADGLTLIMGGLWRREAEPTNQELAYWLMVRIGYLMQVWRINVLCCCIGQLEVGWEYIALFRELSSDNIKCTRSTRTIIVIITERSFGFPFTDLLCQTSDSHVER
jgi:hypothetical protein